MDDKANEPQEFPKVVYRGGNPYDETTGRGVHQRDTRVVANEEEEKLAKKAGFTPYEQPKESKEDKAEREAAELPHAVQLAPADDDGEPNSLRRAVDHLDAQGRSASDRGGDHSAGAANQTGTVDISRSEDPSKNTDAGDPAPREQYHEQIHHYEEGAGVPHIEGGTPTPPTIGTVHVDGKPDIMGVTGTREGKVQTDDLDRLDPSKHLEPDGIILPPGGDPAHQNAVQEHGDAAHPSSGDPQAGTADPAKPHALDHDGDGKKGGSRKRS